MNRLLRNYGMVLVLLALCILFSVLTLKEQVPDTGSAVEELRDEIEGSFSKDQLIICVGSFNKASAPIAETLEDELKQSGFENVMSIVGIPRDLRIALDSLSSGNTSIAAIAISGDVSKWRVVQQIDKNYPDYAGSRIISPETYMWPDFLKRTNLLAIVDRIVVIAIIAIGMTMVIITGGIDLSVGSLIAVSAVIAASIMKYMGGLEASAWAVLIGFIGGILAAGLIGAIGGSIVARYKVAPFITTLAIMLVGRGLAFLITGGFSIYQVPKALPWLGQGATLGIPNTVILLIVLYVTAHVFMSHTKMGRYIYAVGGNEEAARLSGVPVKYVIVFVYVMSALAAGLGGSIQASQLNTGTPNMGMMYELYVIAAVVVGGTSLSGGTGKILGTLIGVFVISVIQNGMNLLGISSYTQQVVLGLVILIAVLLDKVRSGVSFGSMFMQKSAVEGEKA